MSGWERVPLGEIASVKAGNPAPQGEEAFAGGTLPFVRTSDVGEVHIGEIRASRDQINEEAARRLRLFPAGTILFPKSGASTFINHRVLMRCEGYVASHLAAIKANPASALDEYVFYYLTTVDARALVQDQNYPSLTLKAIAAIPVPLPTLEEQRRIVAALDKATPAMDRLRLIRQAKEATMDELETSLLDRLIQPSGPVGKSREWREVELGDVAEVFDGPHATPTKTKSGPWYLSISSLDKGRIDLSKSAHLSTEDFPRWTSRVAPRLGDTLFSYETRLGAAALWESDEPCALGRRMGLLRPKTAMIAPSFLTLTFLSPRFQQEIRDRKVTGATVDRIPIAELPQWPILLPPMNSQLQIVERYEAAALQVDNARSKAHHAKLLAGELRASMLSSFLGGAHETH